MLVSNTSPLTNLAAIHQFDLLQQLYQQVHIPSAVWSELNANEQSWPGRADVARADWIVHHRIVNEPLVLALTIHLDRGESEAIALALELGSDLILIDEAEGRRIVKRYGLQVIGVLGILLDAKHQKLIDAVLPQVDKLQKTAGFYLNQQVYHTIRLLAGE